ncbi:MAG: nitroreductase family protein [Candidatus Bathyarchaeia archaeon]
MDDSEIVMENEVIRAIKRRRSVRSYLPNPPPDEYIYAILDAARWAPSAANLQPWQFIIVKDENTRRKIQELVEENRRLTIEVREEPFKTGFSKYSTGWIGEAPIHIVVCADPKRTGPHVGGEETYKYGASAAIQNLMLAAYSLGLGTCWLTMFNKDRLREILGIPQNIDVIGIVTVGYPREFPEIPETARRYAMKPRRDLSEIVFYERYGKTITSQ